LDVCIKKDSIKTYTFLNKEVSEKKANRRFAPETTQVESNGQVSKTHWLQVIMDGTLKANSQYHAVPLPCHAAQGLDCILPFDLHSAAVFDSHMPCRARAMPRTCVLKAPSQGHGTARHGRGMGMACGNWHRPSRDGMWATWPRSASSGYHAEFYEGCYQKHTNLLHCRTSSSDISGYHADFHEGHETVGE
jgi:hypothetical protein